MHSLPSYVRFRAGVLSIVILSLYVLVPRGVCLASMVMDAGCCRVTASAPKKSCCRLCDKASQSQAPSDEDRSRTEVPLAKSKACPSSDSEELPTPVRHIPDLEMQAVVCDLPALVSLDALSESRRPSQANSVRLTAPPLRLNCILQI